MCALCLDVQLIFSLRFYLVAFDSGTFYKLTICYTRILKMHFRARETSYRVVTTNYMSSLRAFHDLSERMSSMDRFLKFLLNNLKQVSGSMRPDARDLFEL